ncbi:amino acid ABC transporter substrate-binding protein [Catenovulum sediminis]|uniref:Solute-binding protein family 3/N-terminal domain-containing protein n=1 Tax=Catenovulum sediminis TaxID=1740262 RepID=A0ABV1RGK2_9ALTE|nr:amino acid ABC transporter substrate-binding protein [Catenovulum sediminis]
MKQVLDLFILLILFFSAPLSALPNFGEANVLKVPYLQNDYFSDVLKLALKKTRDTHGPYILIKKEWHGPKQRMRQLLAKNRYIRILWSTTSEQREKQLRPIKFSLLKKLNNYRFLLIHKGEQQRFNHVKTIADLRKFTAISGAHWQDTEIFKRNKLPVATSIDTDDLVKMFNSRRGDYFARGAYEVWHELTQPEYSAFELEQNLLLKYNSDYYFFVNHTDDELAQRLEAGLKKAAEDGSFDALFFSIPSFKQGWDAVQNNQRRIIELP